MDTLTAGGSVDTADCFANALMPLAYKIEKLAWRVHRDVKDRLGYEPAPDEYDKLVGWIPEAYQRWADLPEPADFDTLADSMDPVLQRMGISRMRDGILQPVDPTETIKSDLGDAVHCFDGWQGDTKDHFVQFSEDWSDVLANQANLAVALQDAMVGTAKIYRAAHEDIQEIARQTITALLALGGCGGSSDAKVLFTVASALAGVASAMATGGALVALATVSAGAGAVSNLVPDEKELPLGASTAKGVVDNMSDAMRALSAWVDVQERTVARALKTNLGQVTGHRASFAPKPLGLLPRSAADVTTHGWLTPT